MNDMGQPTKTPATNRACLLDFGDRLRRWPVPSASSLSPSLSGFSGSRFRIWKSDAGFSGMVSGDVTILHIRK
jgi:hypothetical protein